MYLFHFAFNAYFVALILINIDNIIIMIPLN